VQIKSKADALQMHSLVHWQPYSGLETWIHEAKQCSWTQPVINGRRFYWNCNSHEECGCHAYF